MGSVETPSAPVEYGKPARDLFLFEPGFRNLNNGSFGSIPRVIQSKLREYQARSEATPDPFIRYEYHQLLDASRAALAEHLNAPVEEIVIVPNATTAINVILRNVEWNADGKDEIISFSTIYGACGKLIDYLCDTNDRVSSRTVDLVYPLEDDEIVALFRSAVEASRAEGKRPRIAVFDVVTSQPGVRFPFELVTEACRELGVMSLIDGAQGIGMVPFDLSALNADFFLSNCHKWLHVPRGCAVLHVPLRNQAMMKSTIPTSHGYVSQNAQGRLNPLPRDASKSEFVANFGYVGTLDNSPNLCVKDALEWRAQVLGGEQKILDYLWRLTKEGGKRAAEILGTELLDNKTGTLTNCGMANVWLPVRVVSGDPDKSSQASDTVLLTPEDSVLAMQWAVQVLMDEYKTFIATNVHNGRWYARLSTQVYLDVEDFEWAGRTLLEIVGRVRKGEYKEKEA